MISFENHIKALQERDGDIKSEESKVEEYEKKRKEKEDDEQSPEQQKDGTTEQIGNTNDKPDNEQKLMADD